MRRLLFLIFLFTITLGILPAFAQADIDFSVLKSKAASLNINVGITPPPQNSILLDLTSYLPSNYSRSGHVDYTEAIQKGINENRMVRFPDFPILISDKGLTIPSNSVLVFPSNAQLILSPTTKGSYNILNIKNVENVKIYAPRIVGDRKRRKNPNSKEGESGMGIAIRSSQQIHIFDAEISECWGDGIYLGKNDDRSKERNISNSNIYIINPVLKNNRRNGISITNADGLQIINPIIANTGGHSPEAGIDIEPNSNRDIINNITIKNPLTISNKRYGIVIALKHLIGPLSQKVNVTIENHIDELSETALRIAGLNRTTHFKAGTYKALEGAINIMNPIWKFNQQYFTMEETRKLYPQLLIQNVTVYPRIGNGKPDKTYINRMKKNYSSKGVIIK